MTKHQYIRHIANVHGTFDPGSQYDCETMDSTSYTVYCAARMHVRQIRIDDGECPTWAGYKLHMADSGGIVFG